MYYRDVRTELIYQAIEVCDDYCKMKQIVNGLIYKISLSDFMEYFVAFELQ